MSCSLIDIRKSLQKAKNILIIAHIQPDGDTLGSCFALKNALERLGKSADICCDNEMPHRYTDLFPPDVLKNPQQIDKEYDTAVAVDCADIARVGKSVKLFKKAAHTINVDHHVTNDGFADQNYIAEVSSVGEIIFELIRVMGIENDEHSAKYLYIAMSTDTGNFTYSNTGKNCLMYVSELVELFDLRHVADVLFRRRTLVATQLIGRALNSLETFEDGKIAFVTLLGSDLKELGANGSECESVVDFAREIEETRVAVFFRELHTGVKVSLRSKEEIDVGAIAAMFGGGGHVNAAGCCIGGKIEEVKKKVLDQLMEII